MSRLTLGTEKEREREGERGRERESIYFRIAVRGEVVPVHTEKAHGGITGYFYPFLT